MSSRVLNCSSPLGDEAFALDAFSGNEGLSQLFEYELELSSLDDAIQPVDLVGKPMGFAVRTEGLGERKFHGRVRSFYAGPVNSAGQRVYRAVLVPWLWFLSRRSNCRVFQHKNAIEIAKEIFSELGFAGDFRSAVNQPPPPLEYCVQYRESDFNFVSRLFEEFGLFYFFEHSADKHVLVLADAKSAYFDCDESQVQYSPGSLIENHVQRWERAYDFTSGKWTVRDYDFVKSKTKLESDIETLVDFENITKYEVYDYPGRYLEKAQGDAKVKAYIAGEEVGHDLARGDSGCISFTPGGKFKLIKHDAAAENRMWLITAIRHLATEPSVRGRSDSPAYANSFTCMPADALFRPPLQARKPLISGLQTAVVVGPAGEEIYTDSHGRIRVQFHWDRKGQKNENSSCWIRVAEPFAGKNFGAFHLPRIGQEVVVSFLEGDPDRPLVIGSVYNDAQPPPFSLPANKTQTGIRSRSSKSGGSDNHNEIRFEDLKGSEQLFIQAEKDKVVNVKNDRTETVGHDEKISIVNNRTEDVGVDEKITIGKNRTEKVGVNEDITIGANRTEKVGANESITIGANRTEQVTANESITIGANQSVNIGGSRALTIAMADAETIGLAKALTVGAAYQVSVGAAMNETVGAIKAEEVGGDKTVAVGGDSTHSVSGRLEESAKEITLTGDMKITLQCGASQIVLEPAMITIKGPLVKINC